MKKNNERIVCQNKRAYHDYYVEDIYECGIVLTGTEIKSVRLGKASLQEAYCQVKNNEMLIYGMHIAKYEQGNIFNHDPLRTRVLLLHKREIIKLSNLVARDGYTLVPLNVHFDKNRAKVDLGLCRGKKLYDKKEVLKEKDIKRSMEKDANY